MIKTGITSVTFRQMDPESIIELAQKAKLDAIEWGSDVHVPPGNIQIADEIYRKTAAAGLRISSYGSYIKSGNHENIKEDFSAVLRSAVALHAPLIRIWAGCKGSAACTNADFDKAVTDTRLISAMAAEENIKLAFEYHPGTLTDNSDSAMRLLRACNPQKLQTYWQPNFDLSHAENCDSLTAVLDMVAGIHLFYWGKRGLRLPLSQGAAVWKDYISVLKRSGKDCTLIMEFVKNDDPAQLLEDADVLHDLILQ